MVGTTHSNDAVMFLPNPNLKIGSWNYFEVRMDAFKTMHYVSHCPVSEADAGALEKYYQELKFQANQVNKFWRQLSDQERHCMMTMLGIGLSGAGVATMGLGAATAIGTAIAGECVLSAVTGGLGFIFTGAFWLVSATCSGKSLRRSLLLRRSLWKLCVLHVSVTLDLLHEHVPFQYKTMGLLTTLK